MTRQTKYMELNTFTNYLKQKMFSVRFIVDGASDDSYRGWRIKKAHKVAKELRKMAKAIEKI
jgi:hypothetical protein